MVVVVGWVVVVLVAPVLLLPPPESKSIAGTPQLTILPSRHTAGAPISTPKYTKVHKYQNTQRHNTCNTQIQKCTRIHQYTKYKENKLQLKFNKEPCTKKYKK